MAKLFNKAIEPACKYCVHGKDCAGLKETLCEKKGVVDPDDHCRSFRYDPLRRCPNHTRTLKDFEQSDFIL